MSDDTLTADAGRRLKCPACAATMDAVPFRDITVDRCPKCHGLWFDALEREHLDALTGSSGLDVGSPSGRVSPPTHLDCPVCHTRMIGMVEPGRPDLKYQSCTVCYGIFTPAGEYREHLAADAHPALDVFHRLFHRGRP